MSALVRGPEPTFEPPPVVGRQAVEERPRHHLGGFLGAGRDRLDGLEAAGEDRCEVLDLRGEPGHVVGQLGEHGGYAGIPVGGLGQVEVAVDEPGGGLEDHGDLVVGTVILVHRLKSYEIDQKIVKRGASTRRGKPSTPACRRPRKRATRQTVGMASGSLADFP